jgi:hypothetical protein
MSFKLTAKKDRALYLGDCFDPQVPRENCIAMSNPKDCDLMTMTINASGEICGNCQKGKETSSSRCQQPPAGLDLSLLRNSSPTQKTQLTLIADRQRTLSFDSCLQLKGEKKCNALPNPHQVQELVLHVWDNGKITGTATRGKDTLQLTQDLPLQCQLSPENSCLSCKDLYQETVFDNCSRHAQCWGWGHGWGGGWGGGGFSRGEAIPYYGGVGIPYSGVISGYGGGWGHGWQRYIPYSGTIGSSGDGERRAASTSSSASSSVKEVAANDLSPFSYSGPSEKTTAIANSIALLVEWFGQQL